MSTPTQFYFENLEIHVSLALQEDVGTGDLTADLIPSHQQADAEVFSREPAIICGRPWFDEVFKQVNPNVKITWLVSEGDTVKKDQLVCQIQGPANSILTAERTALNFLQTLSGTATVTHQYVQALKDSQTQLLDTRKTLPGLRLAQKYAVFCGGGVNHRIGLYDAILIKENHIMSAGSITKAVLLAKTQHPNIKVEVETESIIEVAEGLSAGADIIMLDNFTHEMMLQAMQLNQAAVLPAKFEISGNVELKALPLLAQIGVDYISTGAITKHLHAIDFSMRFKFN
jgi:nicotinate-nucleotide pyrophosphorylase (carboxylating)